MNRTILAATLLFSISTPAPAANIDRELFWNCLLLGYTPDYCIDAINTYHHETTQSGVTILRGQAPSGFQPEVKEIPTER
jgi:hypothetical protein